MAFCFFIIPGHFLPPSATKNRAAPGSAIASIFAPFPSANIGSAAFRIPCPKKRPAFLNKKQVHY